MRFQLAALCCLAAAPLWAGEKVIYGADDRIDVYETASPYYQAWAAATCALIDTAQVVSNGNGTYTIATGAYTIGGLPACSGEPYGDQPVAAFCSGFLVSENIVVTAGHCINQSTFEDVAFVFDWVMDDAVTPRTVVDESQVYFAEAVVARALDGNGLDFAVVRLDRPVTVASPLPMRRDGALASGTAIGVIGHPAGLPKKIAFGAATVAADVSNPIFFSANLDTYGGNSGSPVFNAVTGEVEGILVRGEGDYDFEAGCFVSNQLPDDEPGEEVTKIEHARRFVTRFDTSLPPGAPAGNEWTALLAAAAMTAAAVFLLRKQIG